MPIHTNNGTALGKLHLFNGAGCEQIGKVYGYNGSVFSPIYTAEETVTLTAKPSDMDANGVIKWKNIPVTGFTSVTITLEFVHTGSTFFGGIGTEEASGSVSIDAPSGALYNVKSSNGNNAGTHTKTLSIDPNTTYYVYAAVYASSTSTTGRYVNVTAVFS